MDGVIHTTHHGTRHIDTVGTTHGIIVHITEIAGDATHIIIRIGITTIVTPQKQKLQDQLTVEVQEPFIHQQELIILR